jgi:DNA-binding NarL/FixJ family response regulator
VTTPDDLDRARDALVRKAWDEAYAGLVQADEAGGLDPDGLEQLAEAAHLVGEDDASAAAWTRAHQAWLARGDAAGAARSAFWLGLGLLFRGEQARGQGWMARAQRVLDQSGEEVVEAGYLRVPEGLTMLETGEVAEALEVFGAVSRVGERFDDPDLLSLARLGTGQCLIRGDDPRAGVALLDEAMVAVTTGEVSPLVAGIVYCAVIEACHDVHDVRRAQEWTEALTDWCAAQPSLVPFRGQCLVHRAEILQLRGAWPDAMEEARRACDRLSVESGHPARGAALYQRAELHRLRGDLAEAEAAYVQAGQWGKSPQPGLALLRLAQGQTEAAAGAIRLAEAEARDPLERSKVLAAYVEITLAADGPSVARPAAQELAEIADAIDAPLLKTVAARALGSVLLAEGDAFAALRTLRAASGLLPLGVPHEEARSRALVAVACLALGDHDTADRELAEARRTFEQLGARPDVARLDLLGGRTRPDRSGPLTGREVEVLVLVATGKTNRMIAGDLAISEKTVARHVSNIFVKLNLSSRSAATAYAYEHDLV